MKKKDGRMTKEDFIRRRKSIQEEVEHRQELVDAFRDQRLADLYHESGWTQQEIADAEGISVGRVHQLLTFGKFLISIFTGRENPIPKNLTEWRFRSYWEKTDTGLVEQARFRQVKDLMVPELILALATPPRVAEKILESFGDWEWRTAASISENISVPEETVKTTLLRMRSGYIKGARIEDRLSADGRQYRVKPIAKAKVPAVSADDVSKYLDQVDEILNEALAHTKRHAARCDPTYVHGLLLEIQKRTARLEAILKGKEQRFLPGPIKTILS